MKTSEPIPTLQHIRRQYAPYLRRGDAIRLCATLGAGSAAFKRWCRRSPVMLELLSAIGLATFRKGGAA